MIDKEKRDDNKFDRTIKLFTIFKISKTFFEVLLDVSFISTSYTHIYMYVIFFLLFDLSIGGK
jgi:hypothetical protein